MIRHKDKISLSEHNPDTDLAKNGFSSLASMLKWGTSNRNESNGFYKVTQGDYKIKKSHVSGEWEVSLCKHDSQRSWTEMAPHEQFSWCAELPKGLFLYFTMSISWWNHTVSLFTSLKRCQRLKVRGQVESRKNKIKSKSWQRMEMMECMGVKHL